MERNAATCSYDSPAKLRCVFVSLCGEAARVLLPTRHAIEDSKQKLDELNLRFNSPSHVCELRVGAGVVYKKYF